jgi:hypothetical protein
MSPDFIRGVCIGVILGGLTAVTAVAQIARPPASTQETQTELERFVQKEAEAIEGRLKAGTLGALNLGTNQAITRWDLAVRQWKREKDSGAAPLLAEGVLFDCLGRLQGIYTRQVGGEVSRPLFADMAAARPARAVKSFDAALKLDPHLLEARVRRARLRAIEEPEASRELERIADSAQPPPFAYLAAMSRAETARSQLDTTGAIHWYQRALQLHPTSTAATIGLGVLKGAVIALDNLDAKDPYYSYPCRVLTSDVDAELARRIRDTVSK